MLKLLLYCSYSGSAVGYQKAVVDIIEKNVRRDRGYEIPEPVSYIWTHGGARAAAGQHKGSGYFLAKKISYLNEYRQRDEQGRKVFMNCALIGEDLQELEFAANGFLACYKAATRTLGNLLVVDDTDIGYTVQDFEELERWFERCIQAGKTAPVRVKVAEKPISFIVLEADWEYFISQCRVVSLKGVVCPPNPMSDETYLRLIDKSREEFPIPLAMTAEEQPEYVEAQAAEQTFPKNTIGTTIPEKEPEKQPRNALTHPDAEFLDGEEKFRKTPASMTHTTNSKIDQKKPVSFVPENDHRTVRGWWLLVPVVIFVVILLWKIFLY